MGAKRERTDDDTSMENGKGWFEGARHDLIWLILSATLAACPLLPRRRREDEASETSVFMSCMRAKDSREAYSV